MAALAPMAKTVSMFPLLDGIPLVQSFPSPVRGVHDYVEEREHRESDYRHGPRVYKEPADGCGHAEPRSYPSEAELE